MSEEGIEFLYQYYGLSVLELYSSAYFGSY